MISICVDIASEIGSGGIHCDGFNTCVFILYSCFKRKVKQLELWWDKKKERKCIRPDGEEKEGMCNVNVHERQSSRIVEITYSWASEISLLANMNF